MICPDLRVGSHEDRGDTYQEWVTEDSILRKATQLKRLRALKTYIRPLGEERTPVKNLFHSRNEEPGQAKI